MSMPSIASRVSVKLSVATLAAAAAGVCGAQAAPKCSVLTAKVSVQHEVARTVPPRFKYPSAHAVMWATQYADVALQMSRDEAQASIPGLHDWTVLAILRTWESGAMEPGVGKAFERAFLRACRAEYHTE